MKLNMRTEWHFNSPLKEAFVHLFLLLSIGALASFLTYFLIMLEWGPEKYENSTYFKCMGKEHNGVLDEDCNSDNVVDSTSFLHWIHIAKTNHRVWGVIQDRNYDDIPDWKEVLLTFNDTECGFSIFDTDNNRIDDKYEVKICNTLTAKDVIYYDFNGDGFFDLIKNNDKNWRSVIFAERISGITVAA